MKIKDSESSSIYFNMLFTLTLTLCSYFFPISLKTLSLASEIFRTS
jgi:hypothetical protein